MRSEPAGPAGSYEHVADAFVEARSSTTGVASVLEWAGSLPAGGRILDLGSGHGLPIARALVDVGFEVHGVDASPTLVEAFRRNVPGATVEVADASAVELAGESFDGVIAWGLLFLMPEASQVDVIRTAAAALRPGGQMLATVPWQTAEWTDTLTGRTCVSLGRDRYRALLASVGLEQIGEGGDEDEGGNHYWSAVKLVTAAKGEPKE